jgi:NAD(P)-dependent dehydrogenase (short-subunit alcohol dehydrogenase family)
MLAVASIRAVRDADRMQAWNERVVVVTGGTAGVGRATVRELARRGASVGILARGVEGLDATRDEIEALGGRAMAIRTDVANPADVESAAEWIEAELGPIDAWVNNAMVSVFSPIQSTTAEEFRRVTEVTYLGVVHGTLAALRRMLPRDSGVIVQVGSALAYRSIPLQAAYCAAKHAIAGFTDSLRSELLHDHSGVKVTMVQLPALNTPQFDWVRSRLPQRAQPVPPIYQPEVAARAILRAIERPERESLIGLPTVAAIQLQKLVPGVLDRYLASTAYDGQQTEEPEDAGRADNLFTPVGVDLGAHGRFDSMARGGDALTPATDTPTPSQPARIALVAGAAGLAAALVLSKVRRST